MIFVLFYSLILAIGFGFLSRMCGGGYLNLPLGLDQHIYAFPYGILGLMYGGWLGFAFAYLTAFLGKRTGHGQYMDLGTWNTPVEPERLDFLVEKVFGKDDWNNKWRDFFGLTLTGLLVSIGAGFVLIFTGHVLLGLGVLLGGALKGVAYGVGWSWEAYLTGFPEELNKPTEIGEFLTGFFGGLPVFISIFIGAFL